MNQDAAQPRILNWPLWMNDSSVVPHIIADSPLFIESPRHRPRSEVHLKSHFNVQLERINFQTLETTQMISVKSSPERNDVLKRDNTVQSHPLVEAGVRPTTREAVSRRDCRPRPVSQAPFSLFPRSNHPRPESRVGSSDGSNWYRLALGKAKAFAVAMIDEDTLRASRSPFERGICAMIHLDTH
jgi:hypothetical protein